VENVRRDLILMVRLQKIYDRIAELLVDQRTPPTEIRELHEENVRRKQELEAMEEQIEQLRAEEEEVRAKEVESQAELEHFQKQKATVTNEREFTAVINEIDFATKSVEEAVARRKEIEEAVAQLEREIEQRRQSRPEEEASHRKVVKQWEDRKHELTESIHALAHEARAIEDRLQPASRSRFLRLLKSRQGKAVSVVVDGSCSLCHFELRPHVQQRVYRAEEIITCEHCRRILVLPNIEELFPDEAASG